MCWHRCAQVGVAVPKHRFRIKYMSCWRVVSSFTMDWRDSSRPGGGWFQVLVCAREIFWYGWFYKAGLHRRISSQSAGLRVLGIGLAVRGRCPLGRIVLQWPRRLAPGSALPEHQRGDWPSGRAGGDADRSQFSRSMGNTCS